MNRFVRTSGLAAVVVVATVGVVSTTSSSASAVPLGTIGSFPTYTVTPPAAPGQPSTGTVAFGASTGLPTATFTTDSNTPSAPTGNGAFLGASTGFGTEFGSTRAQPYLTLAAAPGSNPSTTTFAFASALPVGAGFAVGDIDADFVEIIATDAAGTVLTGAQLGARDTGGTPLLNYCNNSPKPSSCTGTGPYTDAPRWFATGTTVVAPNGTSTVVANPVVVGSGNNTVGAYDWFLPTVAIQTLTLRFSVQTGIPNYQVWFAAPAPATTITGTVLRQDGTPAPAGTTVELDTAAGVPVLDIVGAPVTTAVQPDGSFGISTEQGRYQLSFVVPPGFDPIAPIPVDASTATPASVAVLVAPTAVTPPPTPTPTPTPTPAPAELAATGADARALVAGGAGILLLGTALLLARRRAPVPR